MSRESHVLDCGCKSCVNEWINYTDKQAVKIGELQAELAEAKKRIVLSEAQNYCKICGNTLDGYVPPEKENKDGKY